MEYVNAVRDREANARKLHETIQRAESDMSETQQAQLQAAVQHYFKEWLAETGNLRHVMDLVAQERRGGEANE